jgi:flagellar biosynthesis/type III secretory pathway M-ring protein FliF/YscJ
MRRRTNVWTIIWIGLVWLALSVLMAWVWHRLRTSEYRDEYTSREIDQDCAESNLDDADEERDFVMERAKLEADREDAEEGRQERIREKLEAIFSQDDPDEASPEDRRTGREIEDIAAMIVQEAGGRK